MIKQMLFRFSTGLILLGGLLVGVVAFDLGYRGLHRHPLQPEWGMGDADPQRGREAVVVHGCGACHQIPGVRGARGRVGPKLDDFRNQSYIAGVLANNADNLARWIREPRTVNPQTAMPDLGVTEEEARDIAAYLYLAR